MKKKGGEDQLANSA
jgi:hypothetical protein